jgi:hypothetical protein
MSPEEYLFFLILFKYFGLELLGCLYLYIFDLLGNLNVALLGEVPSLNMQF